MSFCNPVVTAWLSAHHGVVSTDVLARLGVTARERRRLVSVGVLARIVDGSYRFTGSPDTVYQRCAGVCMARPELAVSLTTAARLWDIPGFDDVEEVHLLGPHGTHVRRLPWLTLSRTDMLPAEDIVRRPDGIAITSPPRTVVELARVLPNDELALVIEWALRTGLCTVAGLRRVAARLNGPRRPWVRRFLRVLDARLPGPPRESHWEQRVVAALRRRGIGDLTTQVRCRVPGYGTARFDVAIEPDPLGARGRRPSLAPVTFRPEQRSPRDRGARRSGWATDRVGEEELQASFEAAIDDIVTSIEQRRSEVARLHAAGLWT